MIGYRIDANVAIEADDFGRAPFDQRSELGKVHHLFGAEMAEVIEALHKELAA